MYQVLNPASIRIEIADDGQNEPAISNIVASKIVYSKADKIAIVEVSLRLEDLNKPAHVTEAIKWFFKERYFEEYKLCKKYDDWRKKCPLKSSVVCKWQRKYLFQRSAENFRYNDEKVEFIDNSPSSFKIPAEDKKKMIIKCIELENFSKRPRLDTIKWYFKEHKLEYYEKYEKFDGWLKCFLEPD